MRRRHFDLESFEEVSGRADEILTKPEAGKMRCDGAWPDEQSAFFRKWIADGKEQ